MPETPKALAKAAGYDRLSGYYMEFDAAPALKKALDNSSNIYETSSMADLAIQYDIYMKNPWTSGSSTIRLMRNGNISSSANNFFYTPWVFDERASTYYFENGWETVTIPLKNFEAIVTSSTRLIDFIEVLESRGDKSMLAFINCYLNSYNQNICSAVSDFQAFFANLRLVPYATRENQ